MKKLLELPFRKTLIALVTAFVLFILFSMISLYLNRLEFAMYPDNDYPSKVSSVMFFSQLIAGDLGLLSRLILEIATILLLAQGIYRIASKYKKG
jgi:hypothetical protein